MTTGLCEGLLLSFMPFCPADCRLTESMGNTFSGFTKDPYLGLHAKYRVPLTEPSFFPGLTKKGKKKEYILQRQCYHHYLINYYYEKDCCCSSWLSDNNKVLSFVSRCSHLGCISRRFDCILLVFMRSTGYAKLCHGPETHKNRT